MNRERIQNTADTAFFLVGPTCSGKTEIAQWIAEREGFDIVSADSMLVYTGMDIGTAKPGPAERARVRYWGLDLVTVRERFSAAAYRKAALAAIATAASNCRSVIVAGGTGLYIKVLMEGMSARASGDAEIRAKAGELLNEGGIEALEQWLKAENRTSYDLLPDKKNPRRLIRALEVSRAGGAKSTVRWGASGTGPVIPGLFFPPDQMSRRIEQRARRMFAGGLIEETERLLEEGLDSAPTARYAIGYAEAIDYISGRCSVDEAVEKTIQRTRRLAKRQNTWFRHQANVRRLHCDEFMPVVRIAEMVLEHWRSFGPTPVMTR